MRHTNALSLSFWDTKAVQLNTFISSQVNVVLRKEDQTYRKVKVISTMKLIAINLFLLSFALFVTSAPLDEDLGKLQYKHVRKKLYNLQCLLIIIFGQIKPLKLFWFQLLIAIEEKLIVKENQNNLNR